MSEIFNGSRADRFNINADLVASDSLFRAVVGLNDPADYYVGKFREPVALPGNILLFRRLGTFGGKNPHAHHRHVFIIPVRGERSVIVDELTFRIRPGQALLVFPYQFHHYGSIGPEDLTWLFATFEGPKDPAWAGLRNTPCRLTESAWRDVRRLVESYAHSSELDPRRTDLPLLLTLILSDLLRQKTTHARATKTAVPLNPGDRLVQQVSQCVFENLGKPFDIHDLARELGMSYSHLRNVFKSLTATSIGAYVRLVRIHQACVLLMSTNNTVSEVATACGFDSVYSFSRAFKREVGVSPSVYRSEDYSARRPRPRIG